MAKLKVPYVQQSRGDTCMAAALSAIYNYYGVDRSEMDIWQKRKRKRPEADGDFIWVSDLVNDAKENGFDAEWVKVDLSKVAIVKNTLQQLKYNEVPVIVCNQYTKEQPKIGHARIITDISNTSIYMHDPDPKIGGASQRWDWNTFMDSWQPSGEEVVGGVYIIVKKK
jgi:ABC-type bacteriocin/lantibiotic exporter with double-glycine peptidase domain